MGELLATIRRKNHAQKLPQHAEAIECASAEIARRAGAQVPDVHRVYFASSSVQELHSKKHDITAVLDIGTTRSVIGLRAARKVVRAAGQRLSLTPSNRSLRFGVQVHRSLGSIHINVPTPSGILSFEADVIQANVPLLIGLETLDSNRLQVLALFNQLQHVPPPGSRVRPWLLPLFRRGGHIHRRFHPLGDAQGIHYSRHQLTKLHRHLYHPSAEELYQVARRANPDDLPPDTRAVLTEISAACHTCQTFSRAPLTFQISLPGGRETQQTNTLGLDVSAKREPVLHVVDAGTNFNAATVGSVGQLIKIAMLRVKNALPFLEC
jgi:hypothetical protein